MAAPAEGAGDRGRVELGDAGADDGEHPAPHLDQRDEAAGVRQVDDLVDEVGHAVHVLRPRNRAHEDLEPARVVRLDVFEQRVEERALARAERRVQVLRDHLLPCSVAHAPAERVDVPLGDRGVRERARVLVDPEGEDGASSGVGSISRSARIPTIVVVRAPSSESTRLSSAIQPGRSRSVVVEGDDLDVLPACDLLELPEPVGVDGLDDHEPGDRVVVERAGVGDAELLRVQPVELAHVAVDGAGQRRDRAR